MDPVHRKTITEYFAGRQRAEYAVHADYIDYRRFHIVPGRCTPLQLQKVFEIIDEIEYPIGILPQPIAEAIEEFAAPLLTPRAIRQLIDCSVYINIKKKYCEIQFYFTVFLYDGIILRDVTQLDDGALEIMARLPHRATQIDMSALPEDLVKKVTDSEWGAALPVRFDIGNCEYALIYKDIAFYDYEGDFTVRYGESYDLESIVQECVDWWNK